MARIRTSDTGPELAVAALLKDLKIPHRTQAADLPGKPDFVGLGRRLAIFVNGDFWHGRIRREAFRRLKLPWQAKLERNRIRDLRARRRLSLLGWTVITVWESDLKDHRGVRRRLAQAWRTA